MKDTQQNRFFYLKSWEELKYGFVVDHRQWLACVGEATYATVNIGFTGSPQYENIYVLRPGSEPASLIRVSARLGFPACTVPFLQRLVVAEGWLGGCGKPPSTLKGVLSVLVEHILPSLDQAEREAIIDSGLKKKSDMVVGETVLTADLIEDLWDQEVVDEKSEKVEVTTALQRRGFCFLFTISEQLECGICSARACFHIQLQLLNRICCSSNSSSSC